MSVRRAAPRRGECIIGKAQTRQQLQSCNLCNKNQVPQKSF